MTRFYAAYHLFKQFSKTLLHFLYPTVCLHCEGEVKKPSQLLCKQCLGQVEWLQRGCVYCSASVESGRICASCLKHPLYLQPHASLFPSLGPISFLYTDFLHTGHVDALAAFFILGLHYFPSIPAPDCIVPLLQPRYEGFVLKKQSAALLAQRVAKFLKCPIYLPGNRIEGKIVLLITDWLDDAKKLYFQKQNLNQFFPKKIYSVALIDTR